MESTDRSKKNLIVVLAILFTLLLAVTIRLGYIQLVKGEELKEDAKSQQTKDIYIEADRGTIYDSNGEKLALSIKCYNVSVIPSEIGKYEDKKTQKSLKDETAQGLEEALGVDGDKLREKLDGDRWEVVVAEGITKDEVEVVSKMNLPGVSIRRDTKRGYPNGSLGANLMGLVNKDNVGQSGLELEYNNCLSGIGGRIVNYTDNNGRELSYAPKSDTYYDAEDGKDIVTTIDLVIQSYTEDAIAEVKRKMRADRVFAIVMDPETGYILAMAQTPSFDPNNPYEPADTKDKATFNSMSQKEQTEYLNKMWRNTLISDVYEPGSVFKLLTTSIALEEDAANMGSTFTCGGALDIAGTRISCWNSGGHGTQNLTQAVGNSCNPVFMTLAGRIGIDKFYEYMDTFGITGTTGIDFPAEGRAILQNKDSAGPVGLATMGFGQGVAVTPIQLITAISSLGNEGKLMKPKLVKEIRTKSGRTVEKMEPEIVRKTVSKETADEMLDIMEYVVSDGGAGMASVKGYRVGGKTGTANKAVAGGYSDFTYSSCLGMAPMSDPKLTVLVIADSPRTERYGSIVAGPAVGKILSKSLKYLDIKPDADQHEDSSKKVEVPSLIGKTVEEAEKILEEKGLSYDIDEAGKRENFTVVKQYPAAGAEIKKGCKVYLYD